MNAIVLDAISGLELLEVSEPALAGGSAGICNLIRREPAEELGNREVGQIMATTPTIVVTGNPGCLLQPQSGLKTSGSDIPVVHLVQVLDASIRGLSPEVFLQEDRRV
jgi:glycolate oxidase iron-sulfur subunit